MKKEGKIIKFKGVSYHNARDTCKILGISYPMLRRSVIEGEIPYIIFGKRKYFSPEEISDIQESRMVVKKEVSNRVDAE